MAGGENLSIMSRKRAKEEDLDIAAMKVDDLKKELQLRGLDTKGKKTDLVSRLEAAVQGICLFPADNMGVEFMSDVCVHTTLTSWQILCSD